MQIPIICYILYLMINLHHYRWCVCGHSSFRGHNNIPKLLFRTGETAYEMLPGPFQSLHNDTLAFLHHHHHANGSSSHDYFVSRYMSNSQREAFIRKTFPQFLSDYLSIRPGAYQADLWRLLVLYRYGGVYMDLGAKFVHHPTEFIDFKGDDFVAAIDGVPTTICNGFLATRPRHPIIRFMISWIVDNIRHRRYGCNNLDITGPLAISRALHRVLKTDDMTPLVLGRQTTSQGFQVHLLQFSKQVISQRLDNGTITVVILNKAIKDYHQLLYNVNQTAIEPYYLAYYYRSVYHNDSRSIAAKYEGSLVRHKKQVWLVVNGSRRSFPSYDAFVQMNQVQCYECAGKTPELFTSIPEGSPLSQHDQAANQMIIRSQQPWLEFNLTTKLHL